MSLFELFGKKPAPILSNPFDLSFSFHPLRLSSHKQDYVILSIELKNASHEEQLSSLIITVQQGLGFEGTGLSHEREFRLGFLQPNEEKKLKVNIYSSQRTRPGEYVVKMYAASHYRNYGYVVNELKKSFTLRVV